MVGMPAQPLQARVIRSPCLSRKLPLQRQLENERESLREVRNLRSQIQRWSMSKNRKAKAFPRYRVCEAHRSRRSFRRDRPR